MAVSFSGLSCVPPRPAAFPASSRGKHSEFRRFALAPSTGFSADPAAARGPSTASPVDDERATAVFNPVEAGFPRSARVWASLDDTDGRKRRRAVEEGRKSVVEKERGAGGLAEKWGAAGGKALLLWLLLRDRCARSEGLRCGRI
ncbi:unnamed protein product [Closterium sp. NIES-54]